MANNPICSDYDFINQLSRFGAFGVEACFQCGKCSNGCPVTDEMDLMPDEVIRMVLLGQSEMVLSCRTIWVCSACETCTTRCPNKVEIAELMDGLKTMAVEEGIPCPQPQILALHQTFLENVKTYGRIFEATFLPAYMLRSGGLPRKWRDGTWQVELKLVWTLFVKGRIKLLPKKNKAIKEIRSILTTTPKRSK